MRRAVWALAVNALAACVAYAALRSAWIRGYRDGQRARGRGPS